MKQWDVWMYDFAEAGPHPAIIISHPDRVARAPLVNILICTSQRAQRLPKVNEVLLDREDGLEWETLCRCDLSYLVEKTALYQRRGSVSVERRRAIVRTITACFGFNLV